jgi:hypothetical protein
MLALLQITDDGIQIIDSTGVDIRDLIDSTFALWQVYTLNTCGFQIHLGISQSSPLLKNPLNLSVPMTLISMPVPGEAGGAPTTPRQAGQIEAPAFIFAYENGVYSGLAENASAAIRRLLEAQSQPSTATGSDHATSSPPVPYETSQFLTIHDLLSLAEKFKQNLNVCDSLPEPANVAARDTMLRTGGAIELATMTLLSEQDESEGGVAEKLDTLCQHFNLLIAAGVEVKALRAYELAGFNQEVATLKTAAAQLRIAVEQAAPTPETSDSKEFAGWDLIKASPVC